MFPLGGKYLVFVLVCLMKSSFLQLNKKERDAYIQYSGVYLHYHDNLSTTEQIISCVSELMFVFELLFKQEIGIQMQITCKKHYSQQVVQGHINSYMTDQHYVVDSNFKVT